MNRHLLKCHHQNPKSPYQLVWRHFQVWFYCHCLPWMLGNQIFNQYTWLIKCYCNLDAQFWLDTYCNSEVKCLIFSLYTGKPIYQQLWICINGQQFRSIMTIYFLAGYKQVTTLFQLITLHGAWRNVSSGSYTYLTLLSTKAVSRSKTLRIWSHWACVCYYNVMKSFSGTYNSENWGLKLKFFEEGDIPR